jgi:uncharacterized protein (DUF736 family)
MTNKTGNIDEVLNQVDSESEGSIQSLFLNQEIRIKNAEIKTGSKGEYAIIQLDDSNGAAHVVHSSSGVIVDNLKSLKMADLGKVEFPCKCVEKKSSNGRTYLTLTGV